MELESSYQLLGVLRDDGIRTYGATEIASGQALQVHLFARPDSEPDRALFKALRALPVSKRRDLLDIGMEGDKPYIVTEKLPDNVTARDWMTKLAGLPPVKAADPVLLAGSWKIGTPIPDELIRASHGSLPPKPPPPEPKLADLSPDYTRVMRVPSALTPVQPDAAAATSEPPLSEPPPVLAPVLAEAATTQPEVFWGGTPPAAAPLATDAATHEPGEFTRMFLAAHPPESAPPAVPPAPPPPLPVSSPAQPPVQPPAQPVAQATANEPGEFTRMFLASQPVQPVPPSPVPPSPVSAQPVPPPPGPNQPGEFTGKFLTFQPAEPATPTVPPTPIPPNQPGEFTNKFLASQRPQPAPGPAAEESTRLFQSVQTTAPPPAPLQAGPALPTPPLPAQSPSEETTRLFQAVSPSAPPPGPAFPAARPDSTYTPGPAHPEGPSEFTRFFQSPIHPAPAGNQWTPPSPQPGIAPGSPLNRHAPQPGEFTQMFGNPNRPAPAAAPPPPPLGSAGTATGAFSFPKAAPPPPSKASGPGEFTRMMSASAPPTLGQSPVPLGVPPVAPPKPKSMLPLYIAGGAILVAVILIILFFVLHHG